MTRVFLAAGVAALAIASPAAAGPHGGGHGNGGGAAAQSHGNGGGQQAQRGGGGQRAQAQRGGGGGQRAQAQAQRGGGGQRAQAYRGGGGGHGNGGAAFRMQAQRGGHGGSNGYAMQARPQHQQHADRQQRRQARPSFDRQQQRMVARQQQSHGHGQAQNRMVLREQAHGNRGNRGQAFNRQQLRADRQVQRMHGNGMNQNQFANRQQVQLDRNSARQMAKAQRQQFRVDRQMSANNLMAQRHALRADNIANTGAWQSSRFARLVDTPRTRFIAPMQAVGFVGRPVNYVDNYVTLAALPSSVSYLYPDTPNYYYRYGDGYLYQVDRSSSLIGALIPLLAGGYLPGTYLPQAYMSSYVPDYYGLSSFYPASYDYGYGGYSYVDYGYDNLCNRYAYGVIYQVDCYSGMVMNVVPTYAGGYGVGQMIPSAYTTYNLPMQYRDLYYPTADYSYWYAPGAIYQYDTDTSLITSVAALMSPGFSVGQPLPAGYGVYNVPYSYRATYYDTPTAWYRYNNGYIYQVDPTTQLVTAIVASLLT